MRDRLFLILTPALALTSPILATISELSVPASSGVTFWALCGVAAVGLGIGIAAAVLMPNERSGRIRDMLFVCILVATVLLFLDLSAGGHGLLGSVADGRAGRAVALAGLCLVLFLVIWALRAKIGVILFAGSALFFASTIVKDLSIGTGAAPAAATIDLDQRKPPFVYVVFDEAMGIAGLRHAPGGKGAAEEMLAVLEKHSFLVHSRAFSRHFISGRSIPNILNFDATDEGYGSILQHHENLRIKSALFEQLAARGYAVTSYLSSHRALNFCFVVASRCEVFESFNPFGPYAPDDGDKADAFLRIIWHGMKESYLVYNLIPPFIDVSFDGTPALDSKGFPRWFAKFGNDVLSGARGKAFFAHMLFPHSAYVYDEACRRTGQSLHGYFLFEQLDLVGAALEDERARQFAAYAAQYSCLAKTLDQFLTRLEQTPGFEDATIVFHGDHGARISAGMYAETQSDRDMIDNYSALYAIKTPGIEPGDDTRQVSVQRLTAEYFSGKTAEELGPDNRTVVLDSKKMGKVILREMPDL